MAAYMEAAGLEVVVMRHYLEEDANAISSASIRALSLAALFHASATMTARRRSFSFWNRALRSYQVLSVRSSLSLGILVSVGAMFKV